MQRDLSPISFPNTLRDSNDISTTTTKREFVLPSAPHNEQMDFNIESRHSIIRPVEPDHLLSPRINSPNQNHVTNKPLVRSIIRSNDNDDEKLSPEQNEQLHNGDLINDNNLILEASGYDPTRLEEVDADAAYALQLQQEEYSKESLIPVRHPYLPFQVEPDDESAAAAALPSLYSSDDQPYMNDEQLAAYLQEQENQRRQSYHQPPVPFFPVRQQSNPASIQTSGTDEHEIEPVPPFARFAQRQALNDEDDSDEDNPYMNIANPFIQFLANQGRPLPEGFPFFRIPRGRGYRRSGNLQDTEEDFGPEDYERLLQLDDTIHKKKLTKDQINSIPLVEFHRSSNNTEEENKCGVCLELFEEKQTLRQFSCKHVYHKECGDRWLQESNACPICREPPIKGQPIINSRHNRGITGARRPPNSNRSSTTRTNNNNNNNNTHHHRRGPAPQRQS